MDFFDVIKKAFSGDGGDSNLSFFDFLAGDEFSDVPDLWGSGDFDFSKLTSAFNDADIAAFADLGSGSYNSIDDAIIDYAEKSGQDLATAQTKFAASGLKLEDLPGVSKFSTIKNAMKSLGMTDESGKINPAALLGLTGLLSLAGQGSRGTPAPSGYQGTVPKLTAVRERVAIPEDPNRRPGAGGRRYFSDVSFAAPGATPADTQAAVDAVRTAAKTQAATLKPALYPVPQVKAPEVKTPEPTPTPAPAPAPSYASGVAALEPVPKYDEKGNVIGLTSLPPKVKTAFQEPPDDFSLIPVQPRREPLNLPVSAARGGLMGLAKGRYLDGPTDGMEDKIPATISGKQPARLSHGEFVVPADVVSHLGNGNSNAGAQRLYDMMDRIRKARTGNSKQGKQINPNKYLPK